MKLSIKIAAITALSLSVSQAQGFETKIENAGMLYLNIPLSNQTSAPDMDKSVLGFQFGQTRTSTDRVGSIFTYFRSRPALFDVQFGMVGRKNSPDDIHFGLMDLKLTGISSIEKTYINGQAVVGSVIASKVLMGAAAVGGIGIAAAASSSGDSDDDSPSESSSTDDDKNDDVADNKVDDDNEIEHEEENEREHDDDHDDDDVAENEHEEENDHDDHPEGTS
ncbi:MAG: hypothetical protein ACN4GR_00860 [Arenicellales bacterium]